MVETKLQQEIKAWLKRREAEQKEKPLSQLEAEAKAFVKNKK